MFAPSKRSPSARSDEHIYGRNAPTPEILKATVAVGESDKVRAVLLNDEPSSILGIPVTLYVVALDKLDQVQIGQPLIVDGKACLHVRPGAAFL
ncbi:hypothetical protein QTH90_06240 [Variovorax sp. J2P1-59]|uniref:hypothetical protein n=1 Tax=Variovorax flavidus TaxID=3053501 RepID=UPI002577B08B|nr:hypothetical protein [Variovorax sp. J2P1-59]MDM0073973.1 hypothetical protein [Variovorax sp. J2P1-59]